MSALELPRLSVLVPVYNGAGTLGDCLSSVAEQSEGIEVVLVDQGSTDHSVSIAQAFASRMDLKIVSAPENKNWVQNTNLALGLARAPRATLLHQDDLWRPGRAALLQGMFKDVPDAALWLHAADYMDSANRVIGQHGPPLGARARQVTTGELLSCLMVQNTIALPAAAFSVLAAREVGGLDETLWYTADWDFWIALAGRGKTAWNPQRAVAFRLHPISQTISGSRNLEDFAAQLEAPLQRHADAFAGDIGTRVLSMARASNAVNIWMASAYHGNRRPAWPVLMKVVLLGPRVWLPFLRRTRIIQRIWPRLRLLRTRVNDG